MTFDLKELKQKLLDSRVLVTFTKTNGDRREMLCTLDKDRIPQPEVSQSDKKPRKVNDEVLRVYDIEAQGWRSFRLDSVINVDYNVETEYTYYGA